MMTTIDSYSLYTLLISNALLVATGTLVILRFQHQLKQAREFWDSPTGNALQVQDDQALVNEVVDERLASLQAALSKVESESRQQDAAPADRMPFENTVRMAKAGASIDDLVRAGGLSRAEARLFMRVHTKSAA